MGERLAGVCIVTRLHGVKDPGAEVTLEEPGDQLQMFRQAGVGIAADVVAAGEVSKLVCRGLGFDDLSTDEGLQVAGGLCLSKGPGEGRIRKQHFLSAVKSHGAAASAPNSPG